MLPSQRAEANASFPTRTDQEARAIAVDPLIKDGGAPRYQASAAWKPLMGKTVNRANLADTFGVALTTVDTWLKEGCPYRDAGGRGKAFSFDTADVHRWLLLRERKNSRPAKGSASPISIDPETGEERMTKDEADRRKAVADAKKSELDLATKVGLVAPVDMLARVVSDEIANARARLLAIPTKLRPDAQMHAASPERAKKLVTRVDDLIRDALTEIKSYGSRG